MPENKDTIVIKAPLGTKTKWVRESQARGMRLTDWVCMMVQNKQVEEKVPKHEGEKNGQCKKG